MTATTLPAVAFSHGGIDILFDDNRLVSLTSMWKAAGSPPNKEPGQWGRQSQAAGFIRHIAENLNVAKNHIWKSRRGKHLGGVWAHWQLAIAYAQYLSHEFHRLANEAFREWAEEAVDPGLKLERAVIAYRNQGKTPEWVDRRLEGVPVRNALTRTMADHNCRVNGPNDNPYAAMSRSISLGATGRTPQELKAEMGLPKSARTRDHLKTSQLATTTLIETLIRDVIVERGCDGNEACLEVGREISQKIGAAVRQCRSDVSRVSLPGPSTRATAA